MKKVLVLLMVLTMVVSIVGCAKDEVSTDTTGTTTDANDTADTTADPKDTNDEPATHVFMFKSTGNLFGDLMYQGFEEAVTSMGGIAEYISPAETTAAAQVSLVEELINQGVASN
jgi:rhamnose transport system substrate-binding protein